MKKPPRTCRHCGAVLTPKAVKCPACDYRNSGITNEEMDRRIAELGERERAGGNGRAAAPVTRYVDPRIQP